MLYLKKEDCPLKGEYQCMKKLRKLLSSCILVVCFVAVLSVNVYAAVLGEFSTKFNEHNHPRVTNLKLASSAIDSKTLAPGEVFSYNTAVGPTTAARGYQKSKIIVKGKEKEGFGGGVCQISSTSFNAAKNAGLEIIERHPHSKEVVYIEKGKDAATSYGGIDLKFKNTMPYPVTISSVIEGNTILVKIIN